MSIDISVIIPVYNSEPYLTKCLDSIISQTHKNIEIIVVNDSSPGNCEEIVNNYIKNDKRIYIVSHPFNKGLMQARITGSQHAKGKYLLHVDSDDIISETTCEKAFQIAEKKQADIVHFSIFHGESLQRMKPHFSNRPSLTLSGSAIMEDFLNCNIWWTICGKLFKRQTFSDGLALCNISPNLHINQTEDLALFFPVCCLAKTYISAPACGRYYYFITPNSLTKNNLMNERRWEKICDDLKKVRDLVLNTAEKRNFSDADIQRLEKRMISNFIWYANEIKEMPSSQKEQYYARLLTTTNQGVALETVENSHFDILCKSAPFIQKKARGQRSIRHIAIFSSSIRLGGAERVACLLANMLSANDFQLTLFTNEPASNADYDYDKQKINRIKLSTESGKRWTELSRYCSSLSIDLCIFNDHWLPQTMYDMLAVQSWGIPNIIIEHNIYFFPLYNNIPQLFPLREAAYQKADAIICLSEGHTAFWHAAGYKNAIYIPNPLTFDKTLCKRSLGKSLDILFVGRICITKGSQELPHILKAVINQEPKARLILLGRFESVSVENEFRQLIEKLQLTENILILGHIKDISSYYENAKVHIMPSKYEGAPMVLMEAKAHGVPSVIFEMKYLGSISEDEGCIMVGKNDISGMAAAILSLLQDNKKWQAMSDNAFSSLNQFSDELILNKWKELIHAIGTQNIKYFQNEGKGISPEALSNMIMTEFNHAISKLTFEQTGRSMPSYLQIIQKSLDRLFPHNSYRRACLRTFAKKIYNIFKWILRKP